MSLAFLDKMKGSEQPFYLYHATRGCHFDNYPSDEWAGRSMARTVYSDCMVHMDYVLGKLMDKLEEIGEAENTIVIFTSDNGPECEIPPRGRTPFRGCKGSSWEGGVRVPTFVYWKGMIAPAQVRPAVRPCGHSAHGASSGRLSRRQAGRAVPQEDLYRRRRPGVVLDRRQRPVGPSQPHLHDEPVLLGDPHRRVQGDGHRRDRRRYYEARLYRRLLRIDFHGYRRRGHSSISTPTRKKTCRSASAISPWRCRSARPPVGI